MTFICKDCANNGEFKNVWNFAIHRGLKHKNWDELDKFYESKHLPKEVWVHARIKLSVLYERAKRLRKYPVYERKWRCACCNAPLIYDAREKTLSCDCSVIKKYVCDPQELARHFSIILTDGQ